MKKVVLIGDSIRLIGYGEPVEKALSGDFTVWQPSDNCRFAQYTLRGLWDWSEQISGADIIHWNNGLWDICDLFGDGMFTPLDRYVEEMVRLAKLFKERAGAVIFATTTPVRKENPHNKNEQIAKFNEALIPRLVELGVVINDLYTPLARDVDKYICDDLIHLSEAGIELCAKQVESIIREVAATLPDKRCEAFNGRGASDTGAPV